MNAVYLLGSSHVKDSVYFSRLETVYLHRALQEINSSLGDCDHLPDVARASSLIALYFFSTGRIVDGYRHSFSAARLAVGLGLHQIHAPDLHGFLSNSSPTSCPDNVLTNKPPVPLSPPTDCFETHDRVSAFWQVFMVDHCWSAANSLPTLLPDTSDAQARIETPWPMLFPNVCGMPLRFTVDIDFYQATSDAKQDGTSPRLTVSVPAMKVKAALLYERASALYPGKNKPSCFIYMLIFIRASKSSRPEVLARSGLSRQCSEGAAELYAGCEDICTFWRGVFGGFGCAFCQHATVSMRDKRADSQRSGWSII